MHVISDLSLTRRSALKGAIAGLGLIALGSLSGCGGKDSAELLVGASAAPHAEILNKFAKPRLEKQGIRLKVKEYSDYLLPNKDVASGAIDANYFQHVQYLENYNEQNRTDLVDVGRIHYEPFGIYAGRSSDLARIAAGAKIAVPSDPTNEGRALLLVQQQGLIKLKRADDLLATPNDIADNPHHLEFSELEAAAIPRALDSVDFAIINGNYALQVNLHVKDALAFESADSVAIKQYVNIIATTAKKKKDRNIKALVAVLRSDDFKRYLKKTYGEDVQPAF